LKALAKWALLAHNRGQSDKEHVVAEGPARSGADYILKAMIAVATADGRLESREINLIQQIYQDQLGQPVGAEMIAEATQGNTRGDLLAQLTAAANTLDEETKEEIIKASYLVLLADDRIAGEERKKLQDIAAALKIPEIHFGAILEDLAIWLSGQKS
jgi:uncharacterized membrane protein YebE (DUF533 family)